MEKDYEPELSIPSILYPVLEQCPYCSFYSMWMPPDLEFHIFAVHSTIGSAMCRMSKYAFNLQDLASDQLGPSEKLPHMDNRCGSTSPELLCSPRTRSSFRKSAYCRMCNATISDRSRAMMHLYREHLNEPALFACRLCDFKSNCNRQYALSHAMRVHKDINAFVSREEELSAKIETIKNQCFIDCRKRLFLDKIVFSGSSEAVGLSQNAVRRSKGKPVRKRLRKNCDQSTSYSRVEGILEKAKHVEKERCQICFAMVDCKQTHILKVHLVVKDLFRCTDCDEYCSSHSETDVREHCETVHRKFGGVVSRAEEYKKQFELIRKRCFPSSFF